MHEVEPFMSKREFLALFVCSLVPWTIANGLTPLLPLYAAELGASSAEAGCQLALTYAALAAGTVAACWLSDRVQRRRVLIVAGGAMSIPALWLMGQVRSAWSLAAVSAVWCFCAGTSVSLVNILAGASTAREARGKVFGLLSLNTGLGALLGGLAMGPITERWGYRALFVGVALFASVWPAAGLLVQDQVAQRRISPHSKVARHSMVLGRSFFCLFLGSLAATVAAYLFIAGRSLVMARLGFGATAISTTSALSEVPILPLPALIGRLSDRFGRKRFLILGYLAASGGLLGLTASQSMWHFWVSSVLVTTSFITGAVGTALVADLVPERALAKGLSLYSATTWIAGILGCAGAGYAVQNLGLVATGLAGALLPMIAVALLLATRGARAVTLPAARVATV